MGENHDKSDAIFENFSRDSRRHSSIGIIVANLSQPNPFPHPVHVPIRTFIRTVRDTDQAL